MVEECLLLALIQHRVEYPLIFHAIESNSLPMIEYLVDKGGGKRPSSSFQGQAQCLETYCRSIMLLVIATWIQVNFSLPRVCVSTWPRQHERCYTLSVDQQKSMEAECLAIIQYLVEEQHADKTAEGLTAGDVARDCGYHRVETYLKAKEMKKSSASELDAEEKATTAEFRTGGGGDGSTKNRKKTRTKREMRLIGAWARSGRARSSKA